MNLPAGLLDHNYEFFSDKSGSHAYCLSSGQVIPFVQFAPEVHDALVEHFNHFPEKVKAATALAAVNRISPLEQLTHCNYGGFDNEPDMTDGQLHQHEFWNCPERGNCRFEGKCCDRLKTDTGEFLTPAEIQVVKLSAAGHLDKTIAAHLSISPHTVAAHQRNIRRKTNLFRKPDITRFAHQKNLL